MDNKKLSQPENAKLKKAYKFNMIDFILILFIIAAAAMLVYIMLGNNPFAENEKVEILYDIEIPLIRNELVSAVNKMPGAKLTDSARHYELGIVQSVKIEAGYRNEMDLEAGVVYRKPFPEHSRVVITVKAEAVKTESRYQVNGRTVMVGISLNFRTPSFVSYGNCISIAEVNEINKTNDGETLNEESEAE